jgi:hypothetical protein
MWRTVGFLMSFTAVIELASLVAFAVILLGGRDIRESGWKIVSSLLAVVAISQLASMAVVVRLAPRQLTLCDRLTLVQAFLYDHDNRFFVGWKLDRSWILCTISWCVLLLDAVGIASAANLMQPEDDYERI